MERLPSTSQNLLRDCRQTGRAATNRVRDIAAAQVKAWREAADKFHDAATKMAAEKRASVDVAVKQMKAQAAEAEAGLQKLKQAGSKSWTALSAALAQSRKAFDQANQKAWDAFKHAAPPKT